MLQKKYLCTRILYTNLLKLNNLQTSSTKLKVQTFIQPTRHHIINSGLFFKKLAFIGLALSCLNLNKFYKTKIKSLMLVVWDLVASYTFIF